MNPQKLAILVLVLAAAIAGLVYVNMQPAAPVEEVDPLQQQEEALNQSAVQRNQAVIFQGPADQVESIVLHRSIDFSMCKLKRGPGKSWYLSEPLQDRAESGLAIILFNLMYDTAALPQPTAWMNHSLADLGLENPRYDIEVLYRDGREERLQIGAAVPQSSHLFALLDDKLIQIPSQLKDLASREPSQWRDHSMLLWPQTVAKVHWQPAKGSGWILSRQGTQWSLEEPLQSAVDPLRVQALLRLLGARAGSLPSSRAQPSEIERFLDGASKLTFIRRPGEGAEDQVLWVKGTFVLDEARGYFLALAPEDLRFLSFEPEEMRSKRVVAFEPNHISSIRLILNGEEHVLSRSRSGWQDGQGRRLVRASNNKLTTLLRYLSILETAELVKPLESAPVNSILLSKARKPVVRGSVQLRYSILGDGRSAVGALESRQSYAAERNLDEEWAAVLQFEQD